MAVTGNIIKELLRKLNEAENFRPNCTVEETIAAINAVCAPEFQGRLNNQPSYDRETERQGEKMLFTVIPEYHRTIGRTIIDPPFVTFEWKIEVTCDGDPIEVQGCSIREISEEWLLKRGTVYLDTAQLPPSTE